MERELQLNIIKMIHREVLPATGCTEPVAVALTVAHASAILPGEIKSITLDLSANILKNAMGVGIPGTGMIGLPIAIALGAVIAAPEKEPLLGGAVCQSQSTYGGGHHHHPPKRWRGR